MRVIDWLRVQCHQAADYIEKLERERDEAREALRRIVDLGKTMPEDAEEVRIAREILEAAK